MLNLLLTAILILFPIVTAKDAKSVGDSFVYENALFDYTLTLEEVQRFPQIEGEVVATKWSVENEHMFAVSIGRFNFSATNQRGEYRSPIPCIPELSVTVGQNQKGEGWLCWYVAVGETLNVTYHHSSFYPNTATWEIE